MLIWLVIESWLSTTIPRFLALLDGLGVGPSLAGYQAEVHSDVSFSNIATSVLSELSFRQLGPHYKHGGPAFAGPATANPPPP
mgnify:CR=1 FL=1